ncbi:MAG: hypothetical protein ABI831_06060, partial [Betaproteobacteria bacterium]
MKNAALLSHIRQLCSLRLGGRTIMPALLKAVQDLVPADLAEFVWVDADGEVANLFAEQIPPEPVVEFYFRPRDGGGSPFALRFRFLAAQEDPVTALSATDAIRRTNYYHTVLRHLAAEHVLHAVIRKRGRALGQLTLYRRDRQAAFSAGERAAITAIAGYIAHGVEDIFPAAAPREDERNYLDTGHEAMIILSRDGALRHCPSAARRLLLYVTLDAINGGSLAGQHAAISGVMRELVDQMQDGRTGRTDKAGFAPGLVVTNHWGRFVLRAYWLTDDALAPDALIGVQVRRQAPTVLLLSQAMRGLSLSPQQKEVGLLVAQGKSNPQIATLLG